MLHKTFFVHQFGFEGKWCNNSIEVIKWMCDLFGWNFSDRYEVLLEKIEAIEKNKSIIDKNLGLEVIRL